MLASLPEKTKDESLFGVVMSSEIWKSENRIASTPDKGKPHESHPRNVTRTPNILSPQKKVCCGRSTTEFTPSLVPEILSWTGKLEV